MDIKKTIRERLTIDKATGNAVFSATLDEIREIMVDYDCDGFMKEDGYRCPKLRTLNEAIDYFESLFAWVTKEGWMFGFDYLTWYEDYLEEENDNVLAMVKEGDEVVYFEMPYLKDDFII